MVVAERIEVYSVDATASVSQEYAQLLLTLLQDNALPSDGQILSSKFPGPQLLITKRTPREANIIGKDTGLTIAKRRPYFKSLEKQLSWIAKVKELFGGYDSLVEKLITSIEHVLHPSTTPSLLRAPRLYQFLGPPGCGKSHLMNTIANSSGLQHFTLDQGVLLGDEYADLSIDEIISAIEGSAPCFLLLERAEEIPYHILSKLNTVIDRWHAEDIPILIFSAGPIPAVLGSPYCPVKTISIYPLKEDERKSVLEVLCRDLYLGDRQQRDAMLNSIVRITPGYAPCDLDELVRAVCLRSAASMSSAKSLIPLPMFEDVADTIVPSALRQQDALDITSLTAPKKEFDIIHPEGLVKGFASIIAYDKLVENIKHYLKQFLYQRGHGKNLTLCGPAGSGKTHIASAIASEGNAHLFFITPATVLKKELGESEKALAKIFDDAVAAAPSVIVLEGVDYWDVEERDFVQNDGSQHKTMQRLLATLTGQLDNLVSHKDRVVVIATCHDEGNLPNKLLLGHVFRLPLELSMEHRRELLMAYLRGRVDASLTEAEIEGVLADPKFSEKAKQVSDIVHWCREAAVAAVRRGIENDVSQIAIKLEDLYV